MVNVHPAASGATPAPAHIPVERIEGAAMGMPDIDMGDGFPVGGVAAFDPDEGGIVSPGGVGYDINCGAPTSGRTTSAPSWVAS